jgi:hypothetical protein
MYQLKLLERGWSFAYPSCDYKDEESFADPVRKEREGETS